MKMTDLERSVESEIMNLHCCVSMKYSLTTFAIKCFSAPLIYENESNTYRLNFSGQEKLSSVAIKYCPFCSKDLLEQQLVIKVIEEDNNE
jgi:hypothetical protein